MKKLLWGKEVHEKLLTGVEKMAQAVTVSLGPLGRNAGLESPYGRIVVHDGVTIADNVILDDEFEDFGAQIVRDAAREQVDQTGDGTTLVTLLTHAIFRECSLLIAAGYNPMQLQVGLEESTKNLLALLKLKAKKVTTLDEKVAVATIAANNKELGKLVGEILHKLGHEGIINVEESNLPETRVEHQEGMQFNTGWLSPYQITDRERREATVEDPYIVLCDHEVNNLMEIVPLMRKLIGFSDGQRKVPGVTRNVVFIAPDFSNDVLAAAVGTKMSGEANMLTVRCPLFGKPQKDLLKDIALMTGGQVIGEELGTSFESVDVSVCGHAERITSTKDSTLIVGGKGDPELMEKHLKGLRNELEKEENTYQREKVKERIAKLTTGVAVIKVGGVTDVEMKNKKEWTEDAIGSTKEAIEFGIVPGGEITLFNLSNEEFATDELTKTILSQALKAPFKKLLENAGIDYTQTIIDLQGKGSTFGVNVTSKKVVDLLKEGVIDPVSVLSNALSIAVSTTIRLMTTEFLSVEEKIIPKLIKNV